jgi:hypothetical protein
MPPYFPIIEYAHMVLVLERNAFAPRQHLSLVGPSHHYMLESDEREPSAQLVKIAQGVQTT